ncbi:hypothetical protein DB346_15060 [Verrucomicrobia bacterium LW23]|nr:hypothetical protein DB346_15060 [Verrucomicrobia bacterium LW23]
MLSRITSTVRILLLTSALALGVALSPALADKTHEFPKEKAIFTISYPDSWTEVYKDEEYVEYGVKDEISIGAWILKDYKDIKEAANAAGEEIAAYVKEFKVSEKDAEIIKVNGMDMILVEGSGIDKESKKPLQVQVAFFSPDGKTICALLYYGVKGVAEKYSDDVVKIVRSVKAK